MQSPQATLKQRAETEWMLGIAYTRCERWAPAVTALEHSISLRTATAEDWCFLGWARVQSGDLTGAQADLAHAIECDPASGAADQLAQELQQTRSQG